MVKEVCCPKCGNVEHQYVLWLTWLASALVPIKLVLKLDVIFYHMNMLCGGNFPIANIVKLI